MEDLGECVRGTGREGNGEGGQIRLIVWLTRRGTRDKWFSGISQLRHDNHNEGSKNSRVRCFVELKLALPR